MSTFKSLVFLLLLGVSVGSISSCHDHDDDDNNTVTIDIVTPKDGTKAANAKTVEVHVKFSASVEMHELEIKLHPDGNSSNNIIDFDKHTHDKTPATSTAKIVATRAAAEKGLPAPAKQAMARITGG